MHIAATNETVFKWAAVKHVTKGPLSPNVFEFKWHYFQAAFPQRKG